MDRRAVFFLVAAGLCAVLIPATDSELRWVPMAMSIAYAVLAVLSYLDARARHQPPD
jgi:hypothetical protein